ncbi:MAG: hypothetical protein EPN73_01650 [Paraburkholderia sp.]|uniref:hypothetical protein n=1 Tax=Paraburkholderia sp. TaxID=1926495 RepID=UPI0011FE4844|nr:hypothetical protein [Paraburkholderia sp.]TAL98656.1 MAG: hypothetical protein EPN73_01650 [Paraburkholderia sp.]
MKKSKEEKSFTIQGESRKAVYAAEAEYLMQRRADTGVKEGTTSGIAFSGGGIRSACFALGILEWLEQSGMWKDFDYVSSVSGGGYAVASLLARKIDDGRPGKTRAEMVVEKLRCDDGYLRSIVATFFLWLVSVSISAVLVFSPMLLLCGQSASLVVGPSESLANGRTTIIVCLVMLLTSFFTRKRMGILSKVTFILALVFAAIQVGWAVGHEYEYFRPVMISLLGLSWILVAVFLSLRPSHLFIKKAQRLSLFVFLVNLLLSFALSLQWATHDASTKITNDVLAILYFVSLALVGFAMVLNPNRLNPILYTYFKSLRDAFGNGNNDPVWKTQPQPGDPIHLINCFVQSPGTRDDKVQGRGGENFCISRLRCGSESIGYFPTSDWSSGKKKEDWRHQEIWRLVSTSGAAVDAHPTRQSPMLNALHTMLNTGLGTWVINPSFKREHRNFWPSYMLNFAAALGGHNTKHKWLRLSDGGHFENLGLYELVARQCMNIVVVDAGCDPTYGFSDLAAAIEKCREDFDVEIEIPALFPQGSSGSGSQCKLEGTIRYGNSAKLGNLTYLKLTVTEKHSTRMRLRGAIDRRFPHEPTYNQFSTKAFVDAYYQLGYETAVLSLSRRALQPGDVDPPSGVVLAPMQN